MAGVECRSAGGVNGDGAVCDTLGVGGEPAVHPAKRVDAGGGAGVCAADHGHAGFHAAEDGVGEVLLQFTGEAKPAVVREIAEELRAATNRFTTSPLPLPGKTRTILHVETSRNITLHGNTVENPAAQDTLVTLGKNVEAVTGNDTTGIRVVTGK